MSSNHQNLKCHLEKLLSKMSEMRDSQTLTDVSLKVCGKSFEAHRVVLAASSEYFCAMFTDGMRESLQKEIELKDSSVTPAALQTILDFVYKSEINVTEENVFGVLGAADHLQMASVIEKCWEFISESLVRDQLNKLDIQSLQKVLTIAKRHSKLDLQEEVFHKVALVFKEVSETEEFLDYIDVGQLLNLLKRNDLTAPSETFVFKAVIKWIYHDKEERLGHAATLIGAVSLGLVDIRVLISELKREELKGIEECWKMLCEASLYNNMQSLLPELSLVKTETRTMSYVLVAIRENRPLNLYNVTKKVWQEFGGDVPIDESCRAVTSFGNYIYVGGDQTVFRYSIDSNTWDQLPAMRISKRGRYQLIVLGEYLYAIGSNPERYSFREKTWQRIAAGATSVNSAAAALNGCIYAVENSLAQSFDASKNLWTKISNNLCPRTSGYAFVYNDKLIIAGGTSPTQNSSTGKAVVTVEVYCEAKHRWSEVAQTHIDPGDVSFAFEAENKIFLKLKNFVFDTGIRVSPDEPYAVNLDEWRNVTKFLHYHPVITYAPVNLNKLLGDMKDSS